MQVCRLHDSRGSKVGIVHPTFCCVASWWHSFTEIEIRWLRQTGCSVSLLPPYRTFALPFDPDASYDISYHEYGRLLWPHLICTDQLVDSPSAIWLPRCRCQGANVFFFPTASTLFSDHHLYSCARLPRCRCAIFFFFLLLTPFSFLSSCSFLIPQKLPHYPCYGYSKHGEGRLKPALPQEAQVESSEITGSVAGREY